MPYKVYQKLTEEGRWIAIMDVKLSKTKKVDRIFMSEDEANHFIKNYIKPERDDFVKLEEIEE